MERVTAHAEVTDCTGTLDSSSFTGDDWFYVSSDLIGQIYPLLNHQPYSQTRLEAPLFKFLSFQL